MNNEEKNIKEENNQPAENASIGALWNKLNSGVKAGIIAAVALIFIVPIILVFALSGNGGGTNNGNTPGNQDDGDTKISYSVTVKDEAGNPIKDAQVNFYINGGVLAEKNVKTDANGNATPSVSTSFASAMITKIPDGYDCDKLNVDLKFDANGKINVTVKALSPYVVKVVDQYGNPVVGATLQMCSDLGCIPFDAPTDVNGESTHAFISGEFQAKINSLPEGYFVDGDEELEVYYDFDFDYTVTLEVTKAE